MAFNPDAEPFDLSIRPLVKGSVKNLTCVGQLCREYMTHPSHHQHFWLRGQCHFNEGDCLYSHQLTGKVAEMPIRLGYSTPAVAGANANNRNPMYRHWRGESALPNPDERIQRQIARIHAKEIARRQDEEKNVLKDNIIRGQASVISAGYDTLTRTTIELNQSCDRIMALGVGGKDVVKEVFGMLEILAEQQNLANIYGEAKDEVIQLLEDKGLSHLVNNEENDGMES